MWAGVLLYIHIHHGVDSVVCTCGEVAGSICVWWVGMWYANTSVVVVVLVCVCAL